LTEHGTEVIGPSVERVFGYPPDGLIGTNAMEYVHPDDRPAVQTSFAGIVH
jgi:PAS domain S-box-containing protein